MKTIIEKLIPKPVRAILGRIVYGTIVNAAGDTFDLLLWRRGILTPPRRLRGKVGNTDPRVYRAAGEMYFQYFKNRCGLVPNEDVLDVGCGCGNKAVPLTKYLEKSSVYEAFDIVDPVIEWCVNNISSKYPNFHFRLADVFNKGYNPQGKYEASKYKFPYGDESFDFAFAGSVFTHMLPADMENYLSEIARVLKHGGRCLITFFLLNRESLELINSKKSIFNFKYEFGKYRSTDADKPEVAISYDEVFVLELYKKYGLVIKQPIRRGSWSWWNRLGIKFWPLQDIVIAFKE